MVLVFLCLGGWLPSHHRRDTCNHGAAPMETRWTRLRTADTQAVRKSRSPAERVVRPRADPGLAAARLWPGGALGRGQRVLLFFWWETLTGGVCCDARGMANYLGTRRRHVDFLTV